LPCTLLLRIDGVVPGTGRKLNDSAPNPVCDADARQAGAALVEDADDVAVGDAARGRIVRMQVSNLASALLALGAMPAEI